MNTVRNFTTIHLQLTQTNFFKVYNTLNDLYDKVCVPNKTKDLNLSVLNITTRINEF